MKIAFACSGIIFNNHAHASKAQKDMELFAEVDELSDKLNTFVVKFRTKLICEAIEQLLKNS
jgi:hypothetical protein